MDFSSLSVNYKYRRQVYGKASLAATAHSWKAVFRERLDKMAKAGVRKSSKPASHRNLCRTHRIMLLAPIDY